MNDELKKAMQETLLEVQIEAFVQGFMASGEGHNGEYMKSAAVPNSPTADDIRRFLARHMQTTKVFVGQDEVPKEEICAGPHRLGADCDRCDWKYGKEWADEKMVGEEVGDE